MLFLDPRSARMVKYAPSAMLATRLSPLNDVTLPCQHVRNPDQERMRAPVVLDDRNVFDPAGMRSLGFRYQPAGRGRTEDPPAGQ